MGKPNVLLLLADQHRHDWLGTTHALAGDLLRTPNLDRLATEGTRFTHCHVPAPLCGPSRACLASGVPYERCGMRQHERDWPWEKLGSHYRLMRDDGGYEVLATGKLDLNKHSMQVESDGRFQAQDYGFSDTVNILGKWDGWNRHQDGGPDDCPYYAWLSQHNLRKTHIADYEARRSKGAYVNYTHTEPTPLPDDAYVDNWTAQRAAELIQQSSPDKPWYCVVNFSGPHEPLDITASMDSERRAYPPPIEHQSGIDNHDAIRRNYSAMIENIDARIGNLLEGLERSGQLDNTVVIYTADHGEMLGDHNRWSKSCPYDPSVRVPLLVRGPGIRAGVESDALINLIDIGATALDYAGLTVPTDMESRSLRPLLEGQANKHRDHVVSALADWRMISDGRYKLILHFNPVHDGQTHADGSDLKTAPLLFDLVDDPGETKNLAFKLPEKVHELSALLDADDGTATSPGLNLNI